MRARQRFNQKFDYEAKDKVNMYGGLGAVGLDYDGRNDKEALLSDEELDEDQDEYQVPAFSNSAKNIINSSATAKENKEDDEMLVEGFDAMAAELLKIDEEIDDPSVDINDIDKAAYAIPTTDEGFKKILKERFGHDEFLEGQLEAIKILLQKRSSALVVLATGGGKSLIYQFAA